MKKPVAVTLAILMLVLAITGCAAQTVSTSKTPEQPALQTAAPTPEPKEEKAYIVAVALFDSKDYKQALAAFKELGEYKDSAQRLKEIENIYAQKYADAEKLLSEGQFAQAALGFGKIPGYKDSFERARDMFQQVKNNIAISNGGKIVFALKKDGTLYYSEKDFRKGEKYTKRRKENSVDKWKNIVEISGGPMQILGVRSDGKVSATGVNYIICRYKMLVEKWKNVDTVYAGGLEYVIGLNKKGSVLQGLSTDTTNKKITAWKNITAVAAGSFCAFGLKSDGTVVSFIDAAPWAPETKGRVIDVSGWTDIVAIEAAEDYIVGLKSDGTIVIAGPLAKTILQKDKEGLAKFTDIVAISAEIISHDDYNIVGLKSDGTVIAIGKDDIGQCDVSSWKDIIAVRASFGLTLGLKSDGTVVATGDNGAGQCDIVESWKDVATAPLKKK